MEPATTCGGVKCASEFASVKLRDFSTDVFREYALKLASILQEFQLSQPLRSFNLQVRAPYRQTPTSVAWDFILQKQGSILITLHLITNLVLRTKCCPWLSWRSKYIYIDVDVDIHTCEAETMRPCAHECRAQNLLMRTTLDPICRVGFGVHLISLSPD